MPILGRSHLELDNPERFEGKPKFCDVEALISHEVDEDHKEVLE